MSPNSPDGVMPAVGVERARTLTRDLRVAIADYQRAGLILMERVRRAYQERVWVALGYASWADYARGELGVSRAQAYRLVEMAGTTQQLLESAGALGLSPAGDLGLSGRALRDLHGRVDEFAAALAKRVQTGPVDAGDVASVIRNVAQEIRAGPAMATGQGPAEWTEARTAAAQLLDNADKIGTLVLQFAPAYLA